MLGLHRSHDSGQRWLSCGIKTPKLKGGEAVPQGEQEVSGKHLGVSGDVLSFFWTSGNSGWLPGSPGLLAMAGSGSAGVPMLSWWKGAEAVPSGAQAWSGRHLGVPGNALDFFWESRGQGGFLDLLNFWPWQDWALLESQSSPDEMELKRSHQEARGGQGGT